jgi:hypothetical protein
MSDENKGKPSKSVMGNLPSTRPTRMARRRDGEPAANGTTAAEPAAAKRKATATAKARPKSAPKAAAAKPGPKARTRPKAVSEATPKSTKPRAVRSGSPSLVTAKKRSKAPRREPAAAPPKGAELVTTAVQATGELAKIGLTLGGQALKRAVDRIPKP